MPKIRTSRSAAKRFKRTGSGLFARRKAYHSHILTKKSPKRKRALDKGTVVAASDMAKVKRLIPTK